VKDVLGTSSSNAEIGKAYYELLKGKFLWIMIHWKS
jgi:hypothetical protein